MNPAQQPQITRNSAIRWTIRHLLAVMIISAAGGQAIAFTPESEEVRAAIDRALVYLASAREGRVGGKCLVGLAFLKDRQGDHAKVNEARQAAVDFANLPIERLVNYREAYSLGLATIFLCELDPDQHRNEIERLLQALVGRQTKGGAWTYPNRQIGDTSMTQYGVLANWTAYRAGFDVSTASVRNVCGWLLRTQDKRGGFGYNPKDPGEDNERLQHNSVRESMTVAGLGSVYVCSSLLGINTMVQEATGEVGDIPASFVRVPDRSSGSLDVRFDRGLANRIRRAINEGNKWHRANYSVFPKKYPYYYLYAMERYESFKELAEGKSPPQPRWYNDGVRHLLNTQNSSGSWSQGDTNTGEAVGTAFAVLFLQRSTRKSIAKNYAGEGLLVGGRGLPENTRRLRMVDGRVVSAIERRSAAALAQILSDPNSPDFERLTSSESLVVDAEQLSDSDQQSLRQLARQGDTKVKKLALRALASQRNLDNVPLFITALGDADTSVMIEARDALRQLSRKFEGYGLPNSATEDEVRSAQRAWQEWYLSIRPDAEFFD